MRQTRHRPLSQILEEMRRYPPDLLVDAVDGGTILLLNDHGDEIGVVSCTEDYDDGVPDPNAPTF